MVACGVHIPMTEVRILPSPLSRTMLGKVAWRKCNRKPYPKSASDAANYDGELKRGSSTDKRWAKRKAASTP